jgi:uncharacterized SAM-binding protein YcdF (DUF218 family)
MIARVLMAIAAVLGLAWGGGFVWFVHTATRTQVPPPVSGGILVLTGGSNRIEAGLRLLEAGKAPLLLISGVLPGTDPARLIREAGMNPDPIVRRVTLGQSAISTRGNAEEAVDWVRLHGIHSLVVVTSFYHMPRAMSELRRALSGVALHPYPVLPAPLPENDAARRLDLLAQEYTKFLVVRAGLPTRGEDRRPNEGLK